MCVPQYPPLSSPCPRPWACSINNVVETSHSQVPTKARQPTKHDMSLLSVQLDYDGATYKDRNVCVIAWDVVVRNIVEDLTACASIQSTRQRVSLVGSLIRCTHMTEKTPTRYKQPRVPLSSSSIFFIFDLVRQQS